MRLIPIEKDINSSFRIPFEDDYIEVKLRFLSVVSIWTIDISFKEKKFRGLKLSCGCTMLKSQNLPFDFLIMNNIGDGFDPRVENDFTEDAYSIFLVERNDLKILRGYEVE